MVRLTVLLTLALPVAALAQIGPPTPEQLRMQQLHLDENQQQLNRLRLQQPSTPQREQQLQSLQFQLDQQQLEIERLKQQQQICVSGRCQ